MPPTKLSPRVLVVADDLTGLAEVACMAASCNLRGTFVPFFEGAQDAPRRSGPGIEADLLFMNMGCRALPPEQAARRVQEALELFEWGAQGPRVYFKIDSTARGPIAAMLAAARTALGSAVRVPLCLTNPRTGRHVLGGNLSIHGVPLHLTNFAHDPLHPITTDAVVELLGPGRANIEILDATAQADISAHAEGCAGARLAAGAAPFALELLARWLPPGWIETREPIPLPYITPAAFDHMLAVIGSAHPTNQPILEEFTAAGGTIIDAGKGSTNIQGRLPLAVIERSIDGTAHSHMQRLVAAAARQIERHAPETILVTGGETALHLFQHLGVRQLGARGVRHPFFVLEQPARGDAPRRQFWVKPGGYKLSHPLRELFVVPPAEG